jgi:hypothetical protein
MVIQFLSRFVAILLCCCKLRLLYVIFRRGQQCRALTAALNLAAAVAVAGRLQAPVRWLTASTLHARCV